MNNDDVFSINITLYLCVMCMYNNICTTQCLLLVNV